MAIQRFLALTEAEMDGISDLPEHIAWMGCHFSSHSPGISRLPTVLPPGSLLILDDRIPLENQDMDLICQQLSDFVSEFSCPAVLLDFQRPKTASTESLADLLFHTLPVILPPVYAHRRDCSVFLPPLPPDVSLAAYLRPWQGREIWIELALDGQVITLTEQGAAATALPYATAKHPAHRDGKLHCHYHIQSTGSDVRFTLWRTWADIQELIQEAETLGVTGCVGLYQEFGEFFVREETVFLQNTRKPHPVQVPEHRGITGFS